MDSENMLRSSHYPEEDALNTSSNAIAVFFKILAEKGVPPHKLIEVTNELYPKYYESAKRDDAN